MLRELSMVEQRYQAVREVLDTGATITDVAARYGSIARRCTVGFAVTRRAASRRSRPSRRVPTRVLTRWTR